MRALFGSIGDWPAFYRRYYDCCKPGGWFESHESSVKIYSDDGSVYDDSALSEWADIFWEGGNKVKRTFRVLEENIQKECMEAAGFVDVEVRDYVVRQPPGRLAVRSSTNMRCPLKCPIGDWHEDAKMKSIGWCAKAVMMKDLWGMLLLV